MAANIQNVMNELHEIRTLLEQIIVPIATEEARQLITASTEQRKAHNSAVLKRAKERSSRKFMLKEKADE
ncbi:MAG: hypothetical protein FWD70_05465 [Desulfuromonadales bacterium]|nr:hypothetical protein [Desulfuromonadales bacterium]